MCPSKTPGVYWHHVHVFTGRLNVHMEKFWTNTLGFQRVTPHRALTMTPIQNVPVYAGPTRSCWKAASVYHIDRWNESGRVADSVPNTLRGRQIAYMNYDHTIPFLSFHVENACCWHTLRRLEFLSVPHHTEHTAQHTHNVAHTTQHSTTHYMTWRTEERGTENEDRKKRKRRDKRR